MSFVKPRRGKKMLHLRVEALRVPARPLMVCVWIEVKLQV